MSSDSEPTFSQDLNRRKFMGLAAVTAGAMLIKPSLVR